MDRKHDQYLKLATLLDQMVRVYRSLLDCVRRERELLIAANVDDLTENNRAKDAFLSQIKSLEQERIEVARELALALGTHADAPRLSELASVLGGEPADRLRNLRSVLELLLKRVSEINKENEVLVASALQNVSGAMNAIKNTLQETPTYQKRGGMAATPTSSSGQLVRREV